MPTQRPQRLEPRVRDLVAADRQGTSPTSPLPEDLVDVLVAVARGDEDFDAPVSAERALRALADQARPEVAVPVLEEAALDGGRSLAERATAAQTLGDVGTVAAQRALLRAARSAQPRVQQEALASLGRFAGPEAAQELADVAEPRDGAARRQLVFARALVAHRHGLAGFALPEARASQRPVPPAERVPVQLGIKPSRQTASDLRRLHGTTWGMEVAGRALSLRCGPTEWEILLNRRTGLSGVLPTALPERPWIAAVLAQWIPTGERLTTRNVVLTRPVERNGGAGVMRVDVARADGTVVYTGTAEAARGALEIDIADVDGTSAAPTRLSARLTADGVDVRAVSAAGTRVGQRTAQPIQPP